MDKVSPVYRNDSRFCSLNEERNAPSNCCFKYKHGTCQNSGPYSSFADKAGKETGWPAKFRKSKSGSFFWEKTADFLWWNNKNEKFRFLKI